MSVFINRHVEFHIGVFFAKWRHIRNPLSCKSQILHLSQRSFAVSGIIQVFQTEKFDHVFDHFRVSVYRECGRQPVCIGAFIILGQIIHIAAVTEFQMVSCGGSVRHHVEILEFSGVFIRRFIEISFHHVAEHQLADVSIVMAEYLITALVRSADGVAVEGKRGNAVDKQAVKLRAVGSVTEGVNCFLFVDSSVAGRLQHFRHLGRCFFTKHGTAGIKPDLIIFRIGNQREQRFIGALDILQKSSRFPGAICFSRRSPCVRDSNRRFRFAVFEFKLSRLIKGSTLRCSRFGAVKTAADNITNTVSVFPSFYGHIYRIAICKNCHRHTEGCIRETTGISGNAANPDTIIACGNFDVFSCVVRKLFRSETAAGNTSDTVAVAAGSHGSGCLAIRHIGHFKTAAYDTRVGSIIRNHNISLRLTADNLTCHPCSDNSAVHAFRAHVCIMHIHLAVYQFHVRNLRTVRVTDNIRRHNAAVYGCILQRKVADFRVGDTAKKAKRPAFRLVDFQILNGMSLTVKCSGKGRREIRHFTFFSAAHDERTNRSPF